MDTITVNIANVIISINLLFKENGSKFSAFITNKVPKYHICISQKRLKEELDLLSEEYPDCIFSNADAEYNALYRDIPLILFKEKILIFHGVLIETDGNGILFTGESGVGKSTHANLWKQCFGNVQIINGDKPLLFFNGKELIGYGSPWKGKEGIGINGYTKIKAICILKRGKKNKINQVKYSFASIKWLMAQTMLKTRDNNKIEIIKWFNKSLSFTPLYEMECNMNVEAALLSHQTMI